MDKPTDILNDMIRKELQPRKIGDTWEQGIPPDYEISVGDIVPGYNSKGKQVSTLKVLAIDERGRTCYPAYKTITVEKLT